MAVQLRVNTDEMQKLAQVLTAQVGEVMTNFQEIQSVMVGTGNYWHGDAGDADRKEFSGLQEKIDTLMKSLERHPGKLCEIANIMQSVEQDNVSVSAELSKEDFV